jgi:uncharacterized protein Yka (UPF0111/DUF47 family)
MQQNWVDNLPAVVWFIIGLGGVAGAVLAIIKLWQAVVPDPKSTIQKDISSIKGDIHEMRKRVGMLEMDVAKIDQPALVKRLDAFEHKIDRLYDLLVERLTKAQ